MLKMIALRPIRVGGKVLSPGDMFRTPQSTLLLEKGYARPLTPEENGRDLDSYVEEARPVFSEPMSTSNTKTQPNRKDYAQETLL